MFAIAWVTLNKQRVRSKRVEHSLRHCMHAACSIFPVAKWPMHGSVHKYVMPSGEGLICLTAGCTHVTYRCAFHSIRSGVKLLNGHLFNVLMSLARLSDWNNARILTPATAFTRYKEIRLLFSFGFVAIEMVQGIKSASCTQIAFKLTHSLRVMHPISSAHHRRAYTALPLDANWTHSAQQQFLVSTISLSAASVIVWSSLLSVLQC